jgi:hypothetical protein
MIKLQNDYLPCNHQDIDDLSDETSSEMELERAEFMISIREPAPCEKHKISFPCNSKRLYPEIGNMPVYLCKDCGWYCYDGEIK